MLVKVYVKNNVKKEIKEVQVNKGKKDNFDIINEILKENEKRWFNGSIVYKESISLYENFNYTSSIRSNKGSNKSHYEEYSSMIMPDKFEEYTEHDYTKIKVIDDSNVEKEFEVGFEFFKEGFVINLNIQDYGVFIGKFDAYLNNITKGKRNIRLKQGPRSEAKLFKTKAQLIKFLEKNKDYLKHFKNTNNFDYSIEFASDEFEKAYFDSFIGASAKKIEKRDKENTDLKSLLNLCNDYSSHEEVYEKPVEINYDNTFEEEAIERLIELGIWDQVIKNFKKDGTIYVSDVGGIIYDLDEEAEKFVEILRKEGHFPYLVLRVGSMYSVLYVSKYRDDWESEKIDKDGYIVAAASDGSMGHEYYDIGTIQIKKTIAGGYQRIA